MDTARRTAPTGAARPVAERRGAARPAPVRNPEFDPVGLPALRAYRHELIAEEGRAAYWRRLLQTLLEQAMAGEVAGPAVRDAVGTIPAQSSRATLLATLPGADLPRLPEPGAPGRARVGDVALSWLVDAERVLSDYHAAVTARLEAATRELIARYREEPTACLIALPLPRSTHA